MIKVPLTRGQAVMVDDEDADLAVANKWMALRGHTTWYAVRMKRRKSILLHREIWCRMHPGEPAPKHIDHVNGDGLDCRRNNIRAATPGQNQYNKRRSRNNTSGYIGVTSGVANCPGRPWLSRLSMDGVCHNLGQFATPQQAALVRDLAAWCFHGEFARFNFPLPGERGVKADAR